MKKCKFIFITFCVSCSCLCFYTVPLSASESHHFPQMNAGEVVSPPVTHPESVLLNLTPVPEESTDLYAPFLKPETSREQPEMAKLIGIGMALPSLEKLKKKALPKKQVERYLMESLTWIHRVIQAHWLPADLPNRLYAVRKGVSGQDAIIGAWRQKNRIFQIIVTADRIHLLTCCSDDSALEVRDPKEFIMPGLALANTIFSFKPPLQAENYRSFKLGKLVITSPINSSAYPKNWYDNCAIVTDGRAYKFMILKYLSAGMPAHGGPSSSYEPWFLKEE